MNKCVFPTADLYHVMFSMVYYNYEYILYSRSKNRDWSNYVRPIPGVSLRNWMDHINNSAITRFSHLRYMPVQCAPKFILLLITWCNSKSVHATSPCGKGFKVHCILQHSSYIWSTGWMPRGTWRKWSEVCFTVVQWKLSSL